MTEQEMIDRIAERVVERLLPELEAMIDGALTLLSDKPTPTPATTEHRFTHAEIDAVMTPAGGFSRASLAKLGLPYPPPRGWLKRLRRDADALGRDSP